MHPTSHVELNDLLREFCARLSDLLGGQLVGVYLHGSLANGDFDPTASDVDFLVVISDELTSAQVHGVKRIHEDILALPSPFATLLEGSYFPKALLDAPESVGVVPLWFHDHGTKAMSQAVYDNSWVVRWEMHHHGITVVGTEARSLFGAVPSALLRNETVAAMKAWRSDLVSKPQSISRLWNQSFVVLSYCRMLQTLETGKIHSKLASVRWSNMAVPLRWRPLISQAWLGRRNPDQADRAPVGTAEIEETLAFVEYAVTVSSQGPSRLGGSAD